MKTNTILVAIGALSQEYWTLRKELSHNNREFAYIYLIPRLTKIRHAKRELTNYLYEVTGINVITDKV